MRALLEKAVLVARVPISWLPLLVAVAAAACQQQGGSGPGY